MIHVVLRHVVGLLRLLRLLLRVRVLFLLLVVGFLPAIAFVLLLVLALVGLAFALLVGLAFALLLVLVLAILRGRVHLGCRLRLDFQAQVVGLNIIIIRIILGLWRILRSRWTRLPPHLLHFILIKVDLELVQYPGSAVPIDSLPSLLPHRPFPFSRTWNGTLFHHHHHGYQTRWRAQQIRICKSSKL